MSTAAPGMTCYLLEWYRPDPNDEELDQIATALSVSAVAASAEGSPVQLVMTLAVPADDVVFAVVTAGSPEDVAKTCQRAGIPPQRLTATLDARITALACSSTEGSHAGMLRV